MKERYVHDQKAGNFHDVWKHFILSEYLKMCADNFSLTYIDTHSGSLAYRNECLEQLMTGIMKFPNNLRDIPSSTYSDLLTFYGARLELDEESQEYFLVYPGSLAIASYCMLNNDGKIIGCEINEDTSKKSLNNMSVLKRVTKTNLDFECVNTDGYTYAKNYLEEETNGAGVIFVDPPYYPEEGSDWDKCISILPYLKNKTNWTYVLWYCIYSNEPNSHLGHYNRFKDTISTHKFTAIDVQLQINPLTSVYSKSVTGIYIVNPLIKCDDFVAKLHTSGIGRIANLLKSSNQSIGPKITIEMVGDLE